jgi:hypothetical protein
MSMEIAMHIFQENDRDIRSPHASVHEEGHSSHVVYNHEAGCAQ